MSHLSILPTVLRDADCLIATLEALGLEPRRGGRLPGFSGADRAVEVQVRLNGETALGWSRQADGSLALVADLQRISRVQRLQELLGRITRDYAARRAIQQAAAAFPDAVVEVGV
jgi:hypothetical protein